MPSCRRQTEAGLAPPGGRDGGTRCRRRDQDDEVRGHGRAAVAQPVQDQAAAAEGDPQVHGLAVPYHPVLPYSAGLQARMRHGVALEDLIKWDVLHSDNNVSGTQGRSVAGNRIHGEALDEPVVDGDRRPVGRRHRSNAHPPGRGEQQDGSDRDRPPSRSQTDCRISTPAAAHRVRSSAPRPASRASATAAARSGTPILVRRSETRLRTVFGARPSDRPMATLSRPCATSASSWSSRSERLGKVWAPGMGAACYTGRFVVQRGADGCVEDDPVVSVFVARLTGTATLSAAKAA